MNKVVHFEIPVDDMDKAKKFYSSIFGWDLKDWPMPNGSTYVGATTTPCDETTRKPKEPGAINGGLIKRTAAVKSPVVAVHVDSIDESVARIKSMGGSLVVPKWDVMGMGFYACASDPEGNVIGLWEDAMK